MDRKKRLKKIESLQKQIQKHKDKIAHYEGKNDALVDYWEKEIDGFEEQIREEEDKLV